MNVLSLKINQGKDGGKIESLLTTKCIYISNLMLKQDDRIMDLWIEMWTLS